MRVSSALLPALLVSMVILGGLVAVPSADAVATAEEEFAESDGDRQDIVVSLSANGDAEWTIETHFLLTEAETDAFEAYGQAVRDGQRSAPYDRSTFETWTAFAESGTDREMTIAEAGWEEPTVEPVEESALHDVAGAAEAYDAVGTIAFSVTWTDFARVDGDHLHLQETFRSDDGRWLQTLTDAQRFVIEAPPDHQFVTAPHDDEDGQLVWDGPHTFSDGDFNVVVVDRSGPFDGAWVGIAAVGIFVLAALGAVAWVVSTRRGDRIGLPPLPAWAIGSRGGDRSEGTADGGAGADGSDAGAAAGIAGGVNGESSSEPEPVDPELLSDEERVARLLEANGGRMKQAAIVTETGWSNAKVSQLLSEMDDNDEIEKLRIGRENLITLPDVDPTKIE